MIMSCLCQRIMRIWIFKFYVIIKEQIFYMKKRTIFLLAIIALISCKKESGKTVDSLMIEINYNSTQSLKLSEYIETAKSIKLETNANCIIGEIKKIQIFKENIYVLDEILNRLCIFDKLGRFINKLDKIGQGPGEYITMLDFEVNDSGIYTLDASGRAINQYDFDLNYIGKKSFPFVSVNFYPLKDKLFYIYNEPIPFSDYHMLTEINDEGEILDNLFPVKQSSKEPFYWVSYNVFQTYKGDVYFSPRLNNTIYTKNEKEWIKAIQVSFKDKTFPENEDIQMYDIYGPDFPYMLRNHYFISNKYIIVDFSTNMQRYFAFYNKETKLVETGLAQNDLIPDYDRFFPRWQGNDFLIESVNAEYVLEDFPGLLNTNPELSNLKSDDNPVLVIYELKK